MTVVAVDPSALVAILEGEEGAAWLVDVLADADERLIAAASLVELGIVVEARTSGAVTAGRLLREAGLTVVEVDEDFAESAVDAWRRFGKGRHPAGLNYGDCFSYALAARQGVPLVCTGGDFSRTDLHVLTPLLGD